MTPEQIDGFINAWVWVDNHGQQITAVAVAIIPAACMPRIARRVLARRALRHIPAAPDNVQPTDIDDLIVCRRIDRLGERDPHIHRLANDYLRNKQRKEDTP
jgi:hypothetical protein